MKKINLTEATALALEGKLKIEEKSLKKERFSDNWVDPRYKENDYTGKIVRIDEDTPVLGGGSSGLRGAKIELYKGGTFIKTDYIIAIPDYVKVNEIYPVRYDGISSLLYIPSDAKPIEESKKIQEDSAIYETVILFEDTNYKLVGEKENGKIDDIYCSKKTKQDFYPSIIVQSRKGIVKQVKIGAIGGNIDVSEYGQFLSNLQDAYEFAKKIEIGKDYNITTG